MLVDLHYRRLVPAPVAIIRRREDGHHVPVLAPVVALHHQLVRSRHERQAIVVVKGLADVLPERVARSTRGDPPAAPVVGIGPEEVAHGALVRHLLDPVERADVVERIDAR